MLEVTEVNDAAPKAAVHAEECRRLRLNPQRLRREARFQAHVGRRHPRRRTVEVDQGHRLRAPLEGHPQSPIGSGIRGP